MGKLFVISAPSGTGKTSLIKSALEDERLVYLAQLEVKDLKR